MITAIGYYRIVGIDNCPLAKVPAYVIFSMRLLARYKCNTPGTAYSIGYDTAYCILYPGMHKPVVELPGMSHIPSHWPGIFR
jgi:hypothetical protein